MRCFIKKVWGKNGLRTNLLALGILLQTLCEIAQVVDPEKSLPACHYQYQEYHRPSRAVYT